ncbi:hypothetical protein [Sphingobacterium thalpophilum]|uniref:hypothetical protein n=1 Tax=Sphingobacterium thalpophilum TaxID=259 RepID=UPI0031D72BA4
MKRYGYKYLFCAGLLAGLCACDKTEGALYSGEPNKISFLGSTTNVPMSDGTVSVPVGRTSIESELSVPVKLSAKGTGYSNVFTMAGPVIFANGQGKSNAIVKYGDISKIDPGSLAIATKDKDIDVSLAFPFTLSIAEEAVSVSKAKQINVSATTMLEFENKGTAQLNSTDGWAGEVLEVKVQKAKGANVYKLISPFEENSIAFMVHSDGKTVICPNQVIANHPTYGPVSISNVTGSISGNVVTLEVEGYTVSAGSFGDGVEVITLPK